MFFKRSYAVLSLSLLLSLGVQAKGDKTRGEAIFKKINCAQCHGADAMGKAKDVASIKPLMGPRNAGLNEAYIVEQVKAIRDGKRKTPNTPMMMAKVKNLKDNEIEDVAAYIFSLGAGKPPHKGMFEK